LLTRLFGARLPGTASYYTCLGYHTLMQEHINTAVEEVMYVSLCC